MNLSQKENESAVAYYASRVTSLRQSERELAQRDRRLTHLRLFLFLVFLAFMAAGWMATGSGAPYYLLATIVFLAFIAAIMVHDGVARQLETDRERRRINAECIARIDRDWQQLPIPQVSVPEAHRAVATDLDLFGRASLFHFLCGAATSIGRETLRDWLLRPASPAVLRGRNAAADELAPAVEFREALLLEARLLSRSRTGPRKFIAWAESEPWLARRLWLKWTSRVLPPIVVTLLGLTSAGVLAPDVGGAILCALLALNMLLSVFFVGSVHDIYVRISTQDREERRYRRLFSLIQEMPCTSSALQAVKQRAAEQGGGALSGFHALGRIVWLTNTDLSSIKFLLHLLLQTFFLWDFHVMAILEWWQRRYGAHVRIWFEALGELESLGSLARTRYDCPSWSFADVDETANTFSAKTLGHPLIPAVARVANDVEVGPPGKVLLVTGSNMSGKSTLLRAIGINVILAQTGSPVCADSLNMPPLTLETSMRIRDSLEDGISFYMAELQRLKQIVDRADQLAQSSGPRLLYLLDEILLGTNSRERHIAVVRVIAHLLDCQAIGAVSTHDLELAADPLHNSCQTVHFRETLHDEPGQPPMTFDYRLRPGIATTSNALKLLEIVGLGDNR